MQSTNRYRSQDEKNLREIGIHVQHTMVESDFPTHTHEFSETAIVVSGTATHVIGQWKYPLKRGDTFAIKGDVDHGFQNVDGLEIINLMYTPDFFRHGNDDLWTIPGFVPFFLVASELRQQMDYPSFLQLDEKALSYVVQMTDFMLEQQNRADTALYPVLKTNFRALVSFLATQYNGQDTASFRIPALAQALAYMEQHLAEPVRLADIAACTFLSPRQFERLFQMHFGKSPMKFLQALRLKNAYALLTMEKTSVSEAARRSGFEDVSYFTRVFHATYGKTPRAVKSAGT